MRVEQIQSRMLFRANMYALIENGAVGLVDAGFGSGYGRLARVLDGRRPAWVFLTHWHLDHVDWLARIFADYAPTVYCTAESASFLTGEKRWRESVFYRSAGPWWFRPIWGMGFRIWPMQPVAQVKVVAPGDSLNLGGLCWEVVNLEGHTLDSVGLYHAERGALFSGDAAFRRRDGRLFNTSHHYCEDRERVDATFAHVRQMNLQAIYPGHYSCGPVRAT